MFEKGENVGPYQVIEKLGQGGMATVYKAYHANLDRYVALKVLHPALKETEGFIERFEREARMIAKLEQVNIVSVYDYAEHMSNPYLVMRYIEGLTLKARVKEGPLSIPRIVQIVQDVGSGLYYAHQEGVLHRDIKPSNIMLTEDGKIFITDFGLARMAQLGESTLSRDMLIGTPQYISPEQAKGEKVDERSDMYSFAIVIYELMVGQVPYNADTPYAVVHDHIFSPLPMPREINPQVPEAVERFLLRALAKKRNDRYQTVENMVDAFVDSVSESGMWALERAPAKAAVPAGGGTKVIPRRDAATLVAEEHTTETIPHKERRQKRKQARARQTGRQRQGMWALVGLILLVILIVAAGMQLTQVIIEEYDHVYSNYESEIRDWELGIGEDRL